MALPQVKSWLGGDFHKTEAELIENLMKYIDGPDGYEITKSMERDGWDCADSRLVDIMDQGFIDEALREHVRQWVRCIGLKLKLPLGAKVAWRDLAGEVVKLYEDSGEYGIRTPDQKETSCYVCIAEEVVEAPVLALNQKVVAA
jgi:hypothetical protein